MTLWKRLAQNRLLDCGAILVAVLSLIRLAVMLPSRANDLDFSHYYLASRLLLEAKPVYSTPITPLYSQYGFIPFHDWSMVANTPPLLWLFAPFALLQPRQGFAAWVLLEIGSLCAVLWLTWRLLGSRLSGRGWLFACAAVLASDAIYWQFYGSQAQLLLTAVVLAAYALHRARKHTSACLALACAGVLKLFPFILLPWFVWRSGGTIRDRIRRAAIVSGLRPLLFSSPVSACGRIFSNSGCPDSPVGLSTFFRITVFPRSLPNWVTLRASLLDPRWMDGG
jgi:hypothetical protein